MKTVTKTFCLAAVLMLLAGCGKPNEEFIINKGEEADMDKENIMPSEENETVEPNSTSADTESQQEEDALSAYSSEQIEYARVWLQLGANQDIDGLYVENIPAGTPLNPDDETSGVYPENVIQLAGSRLVDGSVTYSGNGDGTINVYKVPLRWDGEYPAGEEFYTEIIDNTELVPVDVGKDEEVVRLIQLLKEQS